MKYFAFLLAVTVLFSACASTASTESDELINDPFEPINRKIYGFNEGVDKAIIGPVALTYKDTVPEPVRNGITNFITNSNEPITFANDVLQGKPKRAAKTFSRFVINTTIGLFGFIDVAGKSNLPGHVEDFGQTLAVWGVPEGVYIVTPLLGPSNLRDTVGRLTDNLFDPLTWIRYGDPMLHTYINNGLVVTNAVDIRARLEPAIENLRSQPEPYTALRRAYASNRDSLIRDGILPDDTYDDLPDFDDYDEFDDFDDFDDFPAEDETPSDAIEDNFDDF